MDDALINLLPVMIAAAAVPFSPIIVLLFLLGEGGLRKSIAFVAGNTSVRLVQGIVFGLTIGAASDADAEDGSSLIVSTLLLVIGILLLISAFKKWRKEEDPDAPPPQWMTSISGFSTLKAAGAGAAYVTLSPKQWLLTLSALSIIGEAEVSGALNVWLYLFFVLAAQVLALAPILMYAVAPQQVAKPLRSAEAWLERYNGVILIAVSLIFGVWFLVKGITGLIGY